jgi:hypothetical protein
VFTYARQQMVLEGGPTGNTPPNNRSPVVTRSHSDSVVVPETTTTYEAQPIIPVEPATLLLQEIDVQEIIQNSRQSIIRTQGTLARLR